MILLSKSTSPIAYADWKYDFAYIDEFDYCIWAAYYSASCLEYEEFDGEEITSQEYLYPTKSTFTSSLLGNSKLFFNTGHGGRFLGIFHTFLYVCDGTVKAADVPDLTSVHGGGSQLFGYIASCHSGENSVCTDIREGFMDEGSEAYLGFIGLLAADDMYQFTVPYFESLGDGNTVAQALTDALADPDHDLDSNDVVLLGDTSITVADA